jgi:RTX calcium-binding nonapeptide repeat (4 copies)
MDSYNRGYGAGIALPGDSASIGNATVGTDSTTELGLQITSNAGFFAISYSWNGQTVISYRGTDNPGLGTNANGGSDILNGWIAGTGTAGLQTDLAIQFYQAVTGISVFQGPPFTPTIVTGHSLGGGLAEMVSALTRAQGVGFDWMPGGVVAAGIAASFPGASLNFGLFRGVYVENEIMQSVRDGSIQDALSHLPFWVLDALKAYLGIELDTLNPNSDLQRIAELTRQFEASIGGTQQLGSYSGFTSMSDRANKLHTMDLLIQLQFAQDNNFTDWRSIGPDLWKAYFNEDVAKAAGIDPANVNGTASAAGKMGRMLAYFALDEGVLVFGNTGIRALFDDANELGGAVGAHNFTHTLSGKIAELTQMLVQFAGIMAEHKVDFNDYGDLRPELGILATHTAGTLSAGASAGTLTLILSQDRWTLGGLHGAPMPEIIGLKTLIRDALELQVKDSAGHDLGLTRLDGALAAVYGEDGVDAANYQALSMIQRIDFGLSDSGWTYVMPERFADALHTGLGADGQTLLVAVGGAGADTITGNSDGNLLAGADGGDTLDGGLGDDLLMGGAGADQLSGGLGDDRLEGGAGADTMDGGEGHDVASYFDSAFGVEIDLTLESQRGSDAEGDTYKDIEGICGSEYGDKLTGDHRFNILIGGGNDTVISQRTAANLDENGAYLKDDEGKQIVLGTFDVLKGGSGYDTYEINSNVYWGNRRTLNGVIPEQIYQHVSAIVEDSDGKGVLKHDGSRRNGQRQHDNCW